MAFEVPLDADRVDDSNLFSTFVRAPLIGTILWILGGNKQEEDEAREKLHGDLDPTTTTIQHQSSSMKRPCSKQRSALKKAAPSLLGSDISDVGEVRESLESMCLYQETLSKYIPGLPKKELSWSDESGRELVDYGKEVSRGKHGFIYSCFVRSFRLDRMPALTDTTHQRWKYACMICMIT